MIATRPMYRDDLSGFWQAWYFKEAMAYVARVLALVPITNVPIGILIF